MNLFSLLFEARKDNSIAQRHIYEKYKKKMFLLCRRYVKSEEGAEEVMMDGFLKVFMKLHKFKYVNEYKTEAWIVAIMLNDCRTYLRKNKKYLGTTLITEDDDVEVVEDITSELAVKDLYKSIAQLPEGFRTIFNLHEVEGLSHKEIAKMLGISKRTAQSQLIRARKVLKEIITNNNKEYENRIQK